jgi:imidazolonepropionase-like amidohydrolase
MHQIKVLLTILLLSGYIAIFAQKTFPIEGIADSRDELYALTNAIIIKSPTERIENATLLIRKGKIESLGKAIVIPKDAITIDVKGKYIYPSFIDIYSNYGLPEVKAEVGGTRSEQALSTKQGAFSWNEALKSEFSAHLAFNTNEKAAKELRAAGFGSVLTHRADGVSRGTGTLVTLGEGREHEQIVKDRASHHLSFSKGLSKQAYPSSLMGTIALLRQTYLDWQWYKTVGYKEEQNASLQAWNDAMGLPQFFEVRDKLEALRAAKIAAEFGTKYIIKGRGDEYQRVEELKKTGSSFILSVKYPQPFDVEDPYDAMQINLGDMKHWELAPSNAARLAKAGIEFAFTMNGLEKKEEFLGNIRKAIENGLSESDALKALTRTPAKMANVADQLGSLETGKLANFIVTNKPIFEKDAKIYQNWVRGKVDILLNIDTPTLTGDYTLKVGNNTYSLKIKGEPEKPTFSIKKDSTEIPVTANLANGLINLSFNPNKNGLVHLSGSQIGTVMSGRGTLENGEWVNWSAYFMANDSATDAKKDEKKEEKKPENNTIGNVTYPFIAYGWSEKPKQATYFIKNATVWTNEKEGILKDADILLQNGKILQVGKSLSVPTGATVIDGTGKHLTAGILDEHSHIAIARGVNEGSQSSTAEVRVGDVIDSEDSDIYRQLAGGVTSTHLLHGSANAIGGQTTLIKLRWGSAPEAMKFENADGFIKFALGENVKQSGWGEGIRYPQTRMGVEQFYDDYFTRARAYGTLVASGKPYRRDLDLETGLEILNKKRFITCHSYVQSEINMLLKVAEKHNFRINTFTHILEGYKVADKMAKHGAAASSFSDWWAYKMEVVEAIPYNGALLHGQGVLTGFNSDDAEMARRLNQEAGKAVMYGNVPEEEALKFVTLNPAKMMHVDNRIGSIKVGKDADVVLWSAHPLSVYAKADATFVDGIKYFDRMEDVTLQNEVRTERARLIQKMIVAKKGGEPTQPVKTKMKNHYHCDSDLDEGR